MVRSWGESSAESIFAFEICENQYFELFVSLSALRSESGEDDVFGAVSRLSLSDTTSGDIVASQEEPDNGIS